MQNKKLIDAWFDRAKVYKDVIPDLKVEKIEKDGDNYRVQNAVYLALCGEDGAEKAYELCQQFSEQEILDHLKMTLDEAQAFNNANIIFFL